VTVVTSCSASTPLFFGHRVSAKWRDRGEATARRKAQNCYSDAPRPRGLGEIGGRDVDATTAGWADVSETTDPAQPRVMFR